MGAKRPLRSCDKHRIGLIPYFRCQIGCKGTKNFLDIQQWEQELACDFFMGARGAIEDLRIFQVANGLGSTQGADTHPDGDLRRLAILAGSQVVQTLVQNNIPLSLDNLMRGFHDFRAVYEPTIFAREQKYLRPKA